jgi:hypothetical protein
MIRKTVVALGAVALAGAGALDLLPDAQAKSPLPAGAYVVAACSPCAAKACNPCAAKAAAAACNPCAAKKKLLNPCNPCAAKACNPCAAKKKM